MVSFAYGLYALKPIGAAHILGFESAGLATDALVEVWDGPAGSPIRFWVHRDGDVVLGPKTAAALATTATDGFLAIRCCADAIECVERKERDAGLRHDEREALRLQRGGLGQRDP